jgi:hypothetical protein
MLHVLHSFNECREVTLLQARVRREDSRLHCEWHVAGDLDQVLWPEPDSQPRRISGLWEHTCFEVFVGPVGESGYTEINLSPAGHWNAFAFDDVRTGMRETDLVSLSECAIDRSTTRVTLQAAFRVGTWPDRQLRLGISSVIEDANQALHYFALAHPGRKPDFHRRDGHIILIEG